MTRVPITVESLRLAANVARVLKEPTIRLYGIHVEIDLDAALARLELSGPNAEALIAVLLREGVYRVDIP